MGHPRLLDHKVAGDLILRDYYSDPEVSHRPQAALSSRQGSRQGCSLPLKKTAEHCSLPLKKAADPHGQAATKQSKLLP